MREIKFRGKRLDNGEWVYGHYHEALRGMQKRSFIISLNKTLEVDPSTVGQFTGLKDKNGTEIFEGDVVVSKGQTREYRQVVEFWNNRRSCGRGWIKRNLVKLEFGKPGMKHYEPEEQIHTFSYFELCENGSCEITGNIHEKEINENKRH